MNCRETQPLLSAYYDHELSLSQTQSIEAHLATCSHCADELASYQKMSELAARHRNAVALDIWPRIEPQLVPTTVPAYQTTSRRKTDRHWLRPAWVAAAILILLGVFAVKYWPGDHAHNEMAANMQVFTADFAVNPDRAQQTLLAHYEGSETSLSEAATALKFQPAIAKGLPQGYAVKKSYLLKMPCCTCIETICERPDGSQFVIMEHAKEQALWFGDHPSVSTECQGMPTTLTDVKGTLAVTCQMADRHLTVIAAQGIEEASQLIGQLARSE
ncbi:MAG: zf-HC2 domain-containing protein [Pirellulales bacterium]|nr:zf-HC2 domain-containing protein [Pirellulales bacterium]